MAIIQNTGFEVAVATGWSFGSGTGTIDSVVFESGAQSCKMVAAVSPPYVGMNASAAKTVGYALFSLRATSVAPPSNTPLFDFAGHAGADMYLRLSTGGVLQVVGDAVISGPTILANTFYRVEMEYDVSSNPKRIRWRTWDAGVWTEQQPATSAQAADTLNQMILEVDVVTSGITLNYDNVQVGEGVAAGEHYPFSRAPSLSTGPLDAKWLDFSRRGQLWDDFWQDQPVPPVALPARSSATWAARAATASGTAQATPARASASWSARAATGTVSVSATPARASATWSARAATSSGTASKAVARSSATWTARAATSSGTASATAGRASVTWGARATTDTGTANATAARASATWSARAATATGSGAAIANAARASATWAARSPSANTAASPTAARAAATWSARSGTASGTAAAAPARAAATWSARSASAIGSISANGTANAARASASWAARPAAGVSFSKGYVTITAILRDTVLVASARVGSVGVVATSASAITADAPVGSATLVLAGVGSVEVSDG
jgi:hypothetical protein